MTTKEHRVRKTNALLARTSSQKMVLIEELTTSTRTRLADLRWSEWKDDLPHWKYDLIPLHAGEEPNTLVSTAGEVFTLITAY